MLYVHKENTVLLYDKLQGIRPTNTLLSLVNIKSFVSYIYGRYIQHDISDLLSIFETIFHLKNTI